MVIVPHIIFYRTFFRLQVFKHFRRIVLYTFDIVTNCEPLINNATVIMKCYQIYVEGNLQKMQFNYCTLINVEF